MIINLKLYIMQKLDGILITGKLASFLPDYLSCFKDTILLKKKDGEEITFSDEAKLYSLLEWSKHLKENYSTERRLVYLYEKCLEYDNIQSCSACISIRFEQAPGLWVLSLNDKGCENSSPF
jgi:hypothetical protein